MYDRIASNVRKTWLLIFLFVLLVTAIGAFIGYYFDYGPIIPAVAVVVAILLSWGGYFKADKIALSASRAQPADPKTYNQLHNIVEGLSIAAGVPKPRVYIVQDESPNAFATG